MKLDNISELVELYKTFFEASADGILMAEVETKKCILANPKFIELFGYSQEELEEMTISDLHPKEKIPALVAIFQTQAEGKLTLTEETPCLTKSGSQIYMDINSAAVTYNGRLCNIGFFRDVTKRVKAQEKEKDLHQKLFKTAKLASIGELASGIAHEINNPLGIISLNLDLMASLGQAASAEDKTEFLNKIHSSVTRITNILKGLRSIAASDESEDGLVDVHAACKTTSGFLEKAFLKKGIKFNYDFKASNHCIKSSYFDTQQMFMNLFINARDAIKERQDGEINIETRDSGNNLTLCVTDNGHGLSHEAKEKIFDLFYTTKENKQNTGIGLWTVYSIIHEIGGQISVESENGKGTSMIITLPAAKSAGLISGEEFPAKKATEQSQEPGKRILIAEDEKEIAVIVAKLLYGLGYEVDMATDGVEALEMLDLVDYNYLVTDLKMPNMGGVELIRNIQDDAFKQDMKVVIITGFLDKSSREYEELNKKVTAIIMKPFNIKELREVFQTI